MPVKVGERKHHVAEAGAMAPPEVGEKLRPGAGETLVSEMKCCQLLSEKVDPAGGQSQALCK